MAEHEQEIPQKQTEELEAVNSCLVAGIGASAGGLEACRQFFSTVPPDSGLAYVLVQHLDPTHESLMVDLLGRQLAFPVVQATQGMPVEPNHLYIIPPNTYLALEEGKLCLTEPAKRRGMRMPIDHLFRSLAQEQHEKAIGIILSGTGSDGTLGAQAIKSNGGLVLVQEPEDAQYDGMPRSVLSTGLTDAILPAARIPEVLLHSLNNYSRVQPPETNHLASILALLKERTRHDFHCYKKNTLIRRIERRMGLNQIDDVPRYLGLLRENPVEVQQLLKDLLISVTSFFRDPEAWKILEEQALPDLVQRAAKERPLRVWLPGCATGEEPYSIAMLLAEQMDRSEYRHPVQIFATDIDENAIEWARAGIYPESIAADISPERLKRFFTRLENGSYQVHKALRERVVFALQNVIGDPPFSKLDMVICRNLLIYLEASVQRRLLGVFHFVLNQDGILFLGSSESPNRQDHFFNPISRKWQIYRKNETARRNVLEFPLMPKEPDTRESSPPRERGKRDLIVSDICRQMLLQEFAPAAVLINSKHEVIYFHGPTNRYLEIPTGEPTLEVTALAREGIGTKLRVALHRTAQAEQGTAVRSTRRDSAGEIVPVRISVRPVRNLPHVKGLTLITFEDEPPREGEGYPRPRELSLTDESLLRQMEAELRSTKEDLQSLIEELETANEELKASNEETMTMNEELQSSNEELESSKEELQSLNEELRTVNSQLKEKVQELELANNDLANLLNATDTPALFLTSDLCIKRFTPALTRLIHLLPGDHGRPIQNFSHPFKDHLLEDARTVLDQLTPSERQLQTPEGRCYTRRILPYRTHDNRIEGVVVTLTDITELRESTQKAQQRARQQAAVAQLGLKALGGEPLPELMDRTVQTLTEVLGVEYAKVLQFLPRENVLLLVAGVGWNPDLVGNAKVSAGSDSQAGYTLSATTPVIVEDLAQEKRFRGPSLLTDHGVVSGLSVIILGGSDHLYGVLGAHTSKKQTFSTDDTAFLQSLANVLASAIAREKVEDTLRLREEEARRQFAQLEAVYATAPVGLTFLDTDLRYVHLNDRLAEINGIPAHEHVGRSVREIVPGLADTLEPLCQQVLRTGQPVLDQEIRGKTAALPGIQRDYQASYYPVRGPDGRIFGINTVVQEITQRKQMEEERLRLNDHLEQLVTERTAQLRVLHAITVAANEARDPESALAFALRRICEHTGWPLAHVYQYVNSSLNTLLPTDIWYEAPGREFSAFRQLTQSCRFEPGKGHIGRVYQTSKAEWIPDIHQAPYLRRMNGIHTAIASPVMVDQEVVAVLEFLSDEVLELDEALLEFLSSVGVQLGRVTERVRMEAKVAEALWGEQRRLGQELHDSVSQELTGAGMLIQGIKQRLEAKHNPEADIAGQIVSALQTTLQQVRTITRGLFPVDMDVQGLPPALEEMVQRYRNWYHLTITCEISLPPHVPISEGNVPVHLFRIAQEALANAVKHANARTVHLFLGIHGDHLRLEIRDDGVGLENSSQGQGLGLHILRHRAELIHAQLDIRSTPGKGTTVLCRLPLVTQKPNHERSQSSSADSDRG